MKIFMRYNLLLLLLVTFALGAEDAVTAIHGTIAKVDRVAKTVVVKTADGTEHTLHFVGKTTVRGADLTAEGAKESGDLLPASLKDDIDPSQIPSRHSGQLGI